MNDEFAWRHQLRQLRENSEPQRDLWPSIAARIAVRPATQRWRMGLGLAAVLAMACGAGVLGWRSLPHGASTTTASTLVRAGNVDSAPLAWAVPADPVLAAAAHDLDSANVELRQALETHPQAVFLVGLLNRTNVQRMRLLQQASAG